MLPFLLLLLVQAAAPQSAPQDDPQRENRELKRRVVSLEERLEKLEAALASRPAPSDLVLVSTLDREVESLKERLHEKLARLAPAENAIQFRPFADMGFRYAKNATDLTTGDSFDQSAFFVNQLDLYAAYEFQPGFELQLELFFRTLETNDILFDIDRLQLRYAVSDALRFTVGKLRTPLGYWARTFFDAGYVFTTVDRPDVMRREDEGGLLPTRQTGAQVSGLIETDAGELEWFAGITNGRAALPFVLLNGTDENSSKAYHVALVAKPAVLEGLQLGASGWFDSIPRQLADSAQLSGLRETIVGATIAYVSSPVELIAEAFFLRHRGGTPAATWKTAGWYAQAGYRFGEVTPYYRHDALELSDAAGMPDPYYAELGAQSLRRDTLGVRWDVAPSVALKAEVGYLKPDRDLDSVFFAADVAVTF